VFISGLFRLPTRLGGAALLLGAALILSALYAAPPAMAQAVTPRIPADARHGVISQSVELLVTIDKKKTTRLAPGAIIRDARNFIIVPSSIPPKSKAAFLVDNRGDIYRVWILTPDEAARFEWPDD